MINRTNCANCGAVLQFEEKNYGNVLACPYCKTEYHIDELGKFDEYKVEFWYMGRKVVGYVSDVKFQKLWMNSFRDMSGQLIFDKNDDKLMLDMHIIGEFVEDEYISI